MANKDRPNGFTPTSTMSGSPWQGSIRAYLGEGNGSDIFPGDAVIMTATGLIDVATATSTEILGVCVGFQAQQAGQTNGVSDNFMGNTSFNLDRQYFDASVDGDSWILVATGLDVLYEVQTSGIITYTDVSNNADLVATAGDTTRSLSQQELNSTTSTTTAQWRIVAPVNRVDNDVTTANSRWVVRLNENHYSKLVGV